MSSDATVQDTLETLAAMRRQEDNGYTMHDCLHQRDQKNVAPDDAALHVDIDCRSKTCEWFYQIVKFCKLDSGESVEIAMSYLDRFLLTKEGAASALQDRSVYQLASVTTLYTAIKIHEQYVMSPQVFSKFARGIHTAEQIEQMEVTILSALKWRMNPPTALSFAREFLKLIPEDYSLSRQSCETAIIETTQLQIKLAVRDKKFIATPSSTIAYCSFMNAIESISGVVNEEESISDIGFILAQSIGLDSDTSDELLDAQNYLYESAEREKSVQKQNYARRASPPSRRFFHFSRNLYIGFLDLKHQENEKEHTLEKLQRWLLNLRSHINDPCCTKRCSMNMGQRE